MNRIDNDTIPPISTKRTISFHLVSLQTKEKPTTYGVRNPGPVLEQAYQCGGVKRVVIIN